MVLNLAFTMQVVELIKFKGLLFVRIVCYIDCSILFTFSYLVYVNPWTDPRLFHDIICTIPHVTYSAVRMFVVKYHSFLMLFCVLVFTNVLKIFQRCSQTVLTGNFMTFSVKLFFSQRKSVLLSVSVLTYISALLQVMTVLS